MLILPEHASCRNFSDRMLPRPRAGVFVDADEGADPGQANASQACSIVEGSHWLPSKIFEPAKMHSSFSFR